MNNKIAFKYLFFNKCLKLVLEPSLLLVAMLMLSVNIYAEKNFNNGYQGNKINVSGVVKDNSGSPLPGVSVVIKGTTTGTITNANGEFNIKSPKDATLVFSFIGMKTKEISVNGKTSINIVMESESIGLDEVVAIGYGYTKKKDLTGAVASVSADNLVKGGTVSNAAQALQGKTAGVQVAQTSKAPGGSIMVRIRGNNSISSTNEPLYVVDGFPSADGLNINPNDIESMQILKDASATAIYGARGANGVVLISTKRGKAGENKITYSGYYGSQKIVNPFDMLDGKEYMLLANDLFREIDGQENVTNGVYTNSQLQSNVNTDWIDVCTRLGAIQDHNIQFRGGSKDTRVLTSIGYYNQEGVLENTDFSRISGRVNVNQKVNKYIRAAASIYAHRENSNYQMYSGNILNSNVLFSILSYDPTVPPYNSQGGYGRPPGGRGDNPLANLRERYNDLTNDKFLANTYVEVEPIKGLKAKVSAGAEIRHNFKGTYLPAATYQGGVDNGVGSTFDFMSTRTVFEGLLNYMKTFNKVHDLSAMLGYSYEKYAGEYRKMQAKSFYTDFFKYNNMGAASSITSIGSNKQENILISFFGRVNYSFKGKYLTTFTLRHDGSSRFDKKNRWGTFPSGSFAWRAGEEEFIKNLNVFSNLKVRLGFGVTGNERIGNYASYALMKNTHLTFDGKTNTSGTEVNPSSPPNPDLRWETTTQYNLGLDMGFIHNRIMVTLDGYYKKTNDLLINIDCPYYSGSSSGANNIGSIANKGVELEISTQNTTGLLKWNTQFNIAMNKNEVLDLGENGTIYITSSKPMGNVSEENYAIIKEGEPLGSLFGYKYRGVLQSAGGYAIQPNSKPGDPTFVDVNNDNVINSKDRTILGNAYPDVIFGLTNNFKYKNFDLSIFFQGSLGNEMLNMTRMNMEWKRTKDALNRWTTTNTNTDIPRNGFYYSKYGGYINDHFIEDASFVRLKNITLGYTVPFKNLISSCRVYVSAENLLTFTGYSGWDPEVDTKGYEAAKAGRGAQTANGGAGLDFNSYPSMKTYTIGLKITF